MQTAITAELEAEARGLRAGLAVFGRGSSDEESERQWDFGDPFVQYDGGMAELSSDTRERLNRLEEDLVDDQHAQAAEDLRLLYSVYVPVASDFANLEEEPTLAQITMSADATQAENLQKQQPPTARADHRGRGPALLPLPGQESGGLEYTGDRSGAA